MIAHLPRLPRTGRRGSKDTKEGQKNNAFFRFPKLKTISDSGMIHGLCDLICSVLRTTGRPFRELPVRPLFLRSGRNRSRANRCSIVLPTGRFGNRRYGIYRNFPPFSAGNSINVPECGIVFREAFVRRYEPFSGTRSDGGFCSSDPAGSVRFFAEMITFANLKFS